ncbi:thiamine phosphate synthase [Fluviicola taffensis]|uniref:thiamine phosphate synthase n=1 Tax=Fluviicola taffensis TaxID=191579 RepID=UPI003138383A
MLIVISESDFRPQEAAIVNELFQAGLDLFHIRKYDASEKELSELIAQIEPEYRQRLVLNHHHELGINLGLKRFHYSERDRTEWQKTNWKGMNSDRIYSTSVHSMEEFNNLPDHFSYAFLSPVFDSISKSDYKGVKFDLTKRQNKATKLIGLGGIQSDNVAQAIRMGFEGVALLGAIWNSDNPVESFVDTRFPGFPLGRGTKGEDV